MVGIYYIENIINDKIYIGSSSNIEKRIANHRNCLRKQMHTNPRLQNSWDKYGEQAFDFGVVEIVALEDLAIVEQLYIDLLNTTDDQVGYNICTLVGRPPSLKGKPKSPEHIAKVAASQVGRTYSPETKLKMAEAQRGKKASEASRLKMSIARKGKIMSDIAKAKMSEAQKKRWAKVKTLEGEALSD